MLVSSEEIRAVVFPETAVPVAQAARDLNLRPALTKVAAFSHQAARAVASLLSPAAFIALVLGAWRLGMDLGWTAPFPVLTGIFSHWQVWMTLAAVLEALAATILRVRPTTESPEQN